MFEDAPCFTEIMYITTLMLACVYQYTTIISYMLYITEKVAGDFIS